MSFIQKKIEFPKPVELNDSWLQKHEGHGLLFFTQTKFKSKKGTKYKVCRCYWCREEARRPIETVSTIVKKHVSEKEIKVSTFNDFEHCAQG